MFFEKLRLADLIIISLAENNWSYSAAFKNLFDWTSRHQLKMFEGKKVIETAMKRFPFHGGKIVGSFSLPEFQNNFDKDNGIINDELKTNFKVIINNIK